jgi:hypothetical protein
MITAVTAPHRRRARLPTWHSGIRDRFVLLTRLILLTRLVPSQRLLPTILSRLSDRQPVHHAMHAFRALALRATTNST